MLHAWTYLLRIIGDRPYNDIKNATSFWNEIYKTYVGLYIHLYSWLKHSNGIKNQKYTFAFNSIQFNSIQFNWIERTRKTVKVEGAGTTAAKSSAKNALKK